MSNGRFRANVAYKAAASIFPPTYLLVASMNMGDLTCRGNGQFLLPVSG
jgi:hypothetical protein